MSILDDMFDSEQHGEKSSQTQEKLAISNLETLRKFIDEGENSGEPINWNVDNFLAAMKKKHALI